MAHAEEATNATAITRIVRSTNEQQAVLCESTIIKRPAAPCSQ